METPDKDKGKCDESSFDFDSFPRDTLFHERRDGRERRLKHIAPPRAEEAPKKPAERREKKERRRRIDPTTFEKQYTDDEMEFMNAMQRFKVQSGKVFPSHGDVLRVAFALGYRKVVYDDVIETDDMALTLAASAENGSTDDH